MTTLAVSGSKEVVLYKFKTSRLYMYFMITLWFWKEQTKNIYPSCPTVYTNWGFLKLFYGMLRGLPLQNALGCKGFLKLLESSLPAMSRDVFNQIRLLNLTSNASRDEESTLSLDNLFHCFTTLIVKDLLLMFSLNLPSFSLKPLKLV